MVRLRGSALISAAAVGSMVVLVLMGLSLRDSVTLVLLVSVQAVAGGYLWILAMRSRSGPSLRTDPLEVLGAALALGTGLAMLSGALLSTAAPGSPGWAVPAAVAGVVWVLRRWRAATVAPVAWEWRRSTLVGLGVAVLVGLGSIAVNLVRYPLGGDGPWTTYHLDMLYFEGLATSVGVFGPGESIFMSGGDVRYHWFTYAWAGQLAHAADAAPFATLTRLLPLVALVGCGALVVTWAARLSNRVSVTSLAALLLVAGGYVGAAYGTILNFDSPSQNLSTLWLMAALGAALAYVRGAGGYWLLVVAGVLVAVTTGGKISAGAVAVVALVFLAVVASARREAWSRRAWAVAGVAALAAAVIYLLAVSGSASGGHLEIFTLNSRASSIQGLDSSKGVRGVVLGTVGLVLAIVARWWGLAWLVGDRQWRWHPDVVLGVGLVVSGVIPVVVLSQGVSETWFALAASAPLAAISAVGVAESWRRVGHRGAMWASVVAGVAVTLLIPVFWVSGPTDTTSVRFWGPWVAYASAGVAAVLIVLATRRRAWLQLFAASAITVLVVAGATARLAPIVAALWHEGSSVTPVSEARTQLALIEAETGKAPAADEERPAPDRASWTVSDVEAATYLRSVSDQGDIVVTNETTGFVVPALVPRLTYMSGSLYQSLYGGEQSVLEIPARIATSLAFTRAADPAAFEQLCDAGVRWGWVALADTPLTSWEPLASVEFQNDSVAVLRLNREACL